MRDIRSINTGWTFTKQGESTTVDLPHTWNGTDGQDGGNDYYRGTCVYEREIAAADMPAGDDIYIDIAGANSSARVIFNGREAAVHHGGYSAFRTRLEGITDSNTIRIEVDNAPNEEVYPQQADFTFYGGIYRDVTLMGMSSSHFDTIWGADDFRISATVNGGRAEIDMTAHSNDPTADIEYEIVDDGAVIYHGGDSHYTLDNPHLWHGRRDPHLYTGTAYLLVGGEVVDSVSTRFGIRSYEITADRGFILNGEEYPLRGVSRHQDRPVIGNALRYEHHREDIDLICEMGATTVRLAHYQHSRDFYDLCDERGLVVWAEIPYISRHMQGAVDNTVSQMSELIMQNFNHPSIVVWGLSNEITMSSTSDSEVVANHIQLNDLCHRLDSTRPTAVAALSMCPIDAEYIHIPDVVSYNHYFGWYGGTTDMNGPWFDKFHAKYPDTPIGCSEYGCEALNWHSSSPQQGDYTEEYQAHYHEELIKQIMDRPYLWATHVWNMFDFAADARAEGGENGMNHKGLVTFDRKYKKDSFFAYKAWLSDEPTLHICGKRYIDRVEDVTRITVYSNMDEVELMANGASVGKQSKGRYPFFYFDIRNEGDTVITARAGDLTDESRICKVDTFNPAYYMQEKGAVINWFEIDTPTGYYSVNDIIGDIISTHRGRIAALRLLGIAAGVLLGRSGKEKGGDLMGFKLNRSLLQMAISMGKGMTVRRAVSMVGNKFTKEQILHMNAILNRVKKPQK